MGYRRKGSVSSIFNFIFGAPESAVSAPKAAVATPDALPAAPDSNAATAASPAEAVAARLAVHADHADRRPIWWTVFVVTLLPWMAVVAAIMVGVPLLLDSTDTEGHRDLRPAWWVFLTCTPLPAIAVTALAAHGIEWYRRRALSVVSIVAWAAIAAVCLVPYYMVATSGVYFGDDGVHVREITSLTTETYAYSEVDHISASLSQTGGIFGRSRPKFVFGLYFEDATNWISRDYPYTSTSTDDSKLMRFLIRRTGKQVVVMNQM